MLQARGWSYGRNALSWAVASAMPDAVAHILQAHASTPSAPSSHTRHSLRGAGMDTSTASESAGVNSRDVTGRTPLHECVALANAGAMVEPLADSSTSNGLDAVKGSRGGGEGVIRAAIEIAEMLIAAGADVNAQTPSGRSPLHELFCRSQDDPLAASFAVVPGADRGLRLRGRSDTQGLDVARARAELVRR